MNNGCNRWQIISQLHLILSATIICLCCVFWATSWAASAATMPEIQRRGYMIVAVKDNSPPLGFKDETGKLQGLEIDLAQRLAADLMGKADAVKLQPIMNRDRLSAVYNHQVDIAIARVTATEARSRLVSFSVPYYYDGTVLITKIASIQGLSDLQHQKIAVLNHSSTIADIRYYIPSAKLIGVDSYTEAQQQLESNAVTAFAADASLMSAWVKKNNEYRILPIKLSTAPLSVVMPKGLQYDDLRRDVNEAIATYIAQGWLKQRIQYWGLFNRQQHSPEDG